MAVACLLRLYRLDTQEVWFDEAFSFHMATMPGILGDILRENTPPLHYLLLRGWLRLVGQSETALRLPSAIAGTLCVAALIWAGRELVAPGVGLWSGLMAAVAPIHIYYSQEARAYALLTLALALTYAALGRALTTDAWRWWALGAAGAVLGLYTHYFALLGLLPTAHLVWAAPGRGRWRGYLGAVLGSGVVFAPWAVWSFLFTSRSQAPFAWIREIWEATPPPFAIPLSLEVFGLGSHFGLLPLRLKQFALVEYPVPLRLLGLAVLLLLGLWVAFPWGDARLGVPGILRRKVGLALLLCFPLAVLWLGSLIKPVYAVGRYDMVAFPAFSLLLGLAFWKLQRAQRVGPVLAAVAALLLLIPIGTKLFLYYQAPSGQSARRTAQALDSVVGNGDVVVFTSLRAFPVLYYLSLPGYRWEGGQCRNDLSLRRFSCRLYPRARERSLLSADPNRVPGAESAQAAVQDFLGQASLQRGALWVVFGERNLSEGKLPLVPGESLLVQELLGLGYQPEPVTGTPWVFLFRTTTDN